MKKLFLSILLIVVLLTGVNGFAEENDDWANKPIINHVYELAKDKLFLEWEGEATLYQVYVDGKEVTTINLSNVIIDLKNGSHQIVVVPVNNYSKDVDTNVSAELQILQFGGGLSFDLAALGINPKDLIQGTSSDIFKINYNPNPLLDAVPEIVNAYTDSTDRVIIKFLDKYNSDNYLISIKNGNDINYVEFDLDSPDAAELVEKDNSSVCITLDPSFLNNQECMIPEMDQKYSISVRLQKYATNFVDNQKEKNSFLESKESKSFDFTPHAAWKTAPVITYASQTGEGKVTLQWEHEDAISGCEYKVMKIDTIMGVKTGKAEIGRTNRQEFVVSDLMNGKYNFSVVPLFGDEVGFASESVSAEVNNEWVTAPDLECEVGKNNQIILTWTSPKEIESYHITVSVASGSLLRFVNMDYEKHTEFDVQAKSGNMKYTYVYDGEVNPESEVKLKFEIYGIRHAADGTEQKSASSSQEILLN